MKLKLSKTIHFAGYAYKSEVKLKGEMRELIELLNDALVLVKQGDRNLNVHMEK